MSFLRNSWYAAGFSAEVTRQPMQRTLLDEPVVLYRTEAGAVVALGDRCPHRFAPLHRGQLFGDAIRCPYHGLRFGVDGSCVDNPIGTGVIPRAARVPSYPVQERNGIVWLWFGPDAAAPERIVPFDLFDDREKFATIQGYVPIQAQYGLVSDNLLDLSHAEFLHPQLSSPGSNRRVQFSMAQEGEVVVAKNWRPGEPITELFRFGMGADAPEQVDHRSIVRWYAPSTLSVEVGATAVGKAPEEGVTTITAHLITPETETTSHYFWKLARDFRLDDAPFASKLYDLVQSAFLREDKPMIEAQQRYMKSQSLEESNPVLLSSDAATARARRIMNEKLKAQRARDTASDDRRA